MRTLLTAAAAALVTAAPCTALAVRPFITDDARVVGDRALQLETWLRADKHGLQHWIAGAIGPLAPLEITLGGVYAYQDMQFAASLPLIQLKTLVLETHPGKIYPGLAFVVGTVGPGGAGPLEVDGWDTFAYVSLTESILSADRLLVHQNLGIFLTTLDGKRTPAATWGIGTQVHVYRGFHLIGELFSGDPYAGSSGGAFQAGFRYFVSNNMQIDGTIGHGVWGRELLPLWGSLGLRIASDPHFW
jgi:hypothetical protein